MKFRSPLFEKPIVHRGLHDNEGIIENSMHAFVNAMNENHPVELDIRITSDNRVVVFHDQNLERLTGINREIRQIDYPELKKIKLKNTQNTIPAIDEVLELINGKVPLLIDIKNGRTFGVLENKLLKSLKSYKGFAAVHSSSPFSCYWIKKKSPSIEIGQLVSTSAGTDFLGRTKITLKNKLLYNFVKPDFLSCNIDFLPDSWVDRLRNKGIPVLSWTIKTEEQREKAMKYSDNFIWETSL